MNITNDMMGFNFSRKKDNYRIRLISWVRYIETLESCLEAEEEERIYTEFALKVNNHELVNFRYKYKDWL